MLRAPERWDAVQILIIIIIIRGSLVLFSFLDHDFQFLQELSKAGTREGLFRYCEPGDGPEKLKEKVEELFDYAMYR